MTPTSRANSADVRAQRRVWWLTAVGLGAGVLVLILVSSTLRQFRVARQELQFAQTAVTSFTAELNDIIGRGGDNWTDVLSGDLPATNHWPAELIKTLHRARSVGRQPGVAQAFARLETSAEHLAAIDKQCSEWQVRHHQIRTGKVAIVRGVDDRLAELTAAITSEAGREKLRTAGTVRQFRSLDGSNAVKAAREIVTQFQSESVLTESLVEISDLARLAGRLASGSSPYELADLKDNLIAASMSRLRQNLARADRTKEGQLRPKLEAVQGVLLGTNRIMGTPSLLPAGKLTECLYDLCREQLAMERRRAELNRAASDEINRFKADLSTLDTATTGLVHGLTRATEHQLENVWWNSAAVGALAAALFLLLAASVAKAIGRQMTNLERSQAELSAKSEQIEQAHASLAAERARLKSFVEHAPAAVAMFDLDVRYVAVSRRWLADYKLENVEVVGRSHYDVFAKIPDRWKQIHQRCLAGAVERCEDDCWRPDGEEEDQHLRWEVRPWYDREQRVAGIMMFTQDITVERRRAAEIERMRDAAQAASRAKSEFLATMSHEIRTPMNGVLGFTNLLMETPLSSDQAQWVQTIRSSGESLLTIINDILDFSKIEAGKVRLDAVPFELRELVEQVVILLASQAAAKNVLLVLDYQGGAPSRLIGDPGRVRQIVLNLVGNAVKFTSRGHVLVRVAGSPESPGLVRVSVQDTGIGIPRAKQAMLFNKFSQTDSSSTRRFGGTGLGLAICKQLTELMGGTIGVESDEAAGSTFWFTLPVPAEVEQPSPPRVPRDLLGRRVLIVQRAEIHRQVLAAQLRSLQLEPVVGAGAEEAVRALATAPREEPFTWIVLDSEDLPAVMGALRDGPGQRPGLLIIQSNSAMADAPPVSPEFSFVSLGFPLVRTLQLLDALTSVAQNAVASTRLLPSTHSISARPATSPPVDSPSKPVRNVRYRVLVAEDNRTNQVLARRFLEDLGCQVDIATNGKEAIERSKANRYDIIFMDCHMPETDGFDATEAIRSREAEGSGHNNSSGGRERIPIVALTASAFSEDHRRAEAAGMDALIGKPTTKAELQRTLETFVDREGRLAP